MTGLSQSLSAIIAITLLVLGSPAKAEFRVFRLKIVNSETGTDREVVSRLDDLQYAGYFPIKRSEAISIEQTWMCFDRNDYAGTLCPAPEQTAPAPASAPLDRNPASPPR